jgi:hypothetical protein
MNPARRDKSLIVAGKLGIDLDEYQITGIEDLFARNTALVML